MGAVLACVDRSAYAGAVCDHALWFAGGMRSRVDVLHVVEGKDAPVRPFLGWSRPKRIGDPAVLAVDRLANEGAEGARAIVEHGDFVDIVGETGKSADLIILGKRGENSDQRRHTLGGNVDSVLRSTQTPVCVVANRFLPMSRALVLLDDRLDHRRAVEFVAEAPCLKGLEIDLAMMSDGRAGGPKLAWARDKLGTRNADIHAAPTPDDAARRYLAERGSDLLILSREVLFADPDTKVTRVEAESLWRWRMPVLIC